MIAANLIPVALVVLAVVAVVVTVGVVAVAMHAAAAVAALAIVVAATIAVMHNVAAYHNGVFGSKVVLLLISTKTMLPCRALLAVANVRQSPGVASRENEGETY